MAQFDVYANTGRHADSTPYLVDVQHSLFDDMGSRMVIPLRSLQHFPQVQLPTRLTPVLRVQGENYLLETPKMGAVPSRLLKQALTSVAEERAQITAALDFLFQGY